MKKKSPKKLALHRETLQEIHRRHARTAAGGTVDDPPETTLYPTEVWSSCPPCD